MPSAPLLPVHRPRLLARIARARVAVLEAGGGYGKSTLLDQAVADAGIAAVRLDLPGVAPGAAPVLGALRRAVRAAGLGALDAALAEAADEDEDALVARAVDAVREELAARSDPVLLVIDEVSAPAGRGITLIAGVVGAWTPPHRVLLAGRSGAVTLAGMARSEAPDTPILGPADLALTDDEVESLARAGGRPIDGVAARDVVAETGGWPAAVALRLAADGRPVTGVGGTGMEAPLDALLEAAGPGVADLAISLAQPPLLDPATADRAAGDDALGRALAAGLPLRRRGDGWLELPEPVREVLRRRGRLVPARIRGVADAYLDRGEPALALRFLASAGEPEVLAATLADRSWHELTVLDAGELRAALSTLPDAAVAAHPRVLLAAARVAETGVHVRWRTALLERALALPAVAADPVLLREVLAEQAADASRSGEEERALALARDVLAGAGPAEVCTRAIALTAVGRVEAFSRDPAAMVIAIEGLTEAAALLRTLDEPDLLRTALQVLGYGIHFARGDLDAAIAALREAADLVPGAIRTRAGVQTFLADALVATGAFDEAEAVLRDELGVARRLRDGRLLAYHAWMRASIASRQGDAAGVEAWLAEAERHPADWFVHPTGIEFLADAVDHLGRVGLVEEAARMLARVEARCAADGRPGVDQIALVARAVHAARAGDPAAAERDLVACLSTEQVPPREHWRIHLLRAFAALRGGDEPVARRHARRASEMARAMGHPDLPRLLEPGIEARLAALAPEVVVPGAPQPPGSEPHPDAGAAPRWHVRVLGRFVVTLDGVAADPPDGRPSQLVKLLAVAGRQLPVDEAVEALWPDADPDLGRQRLRNVLARVRGACGELVVREAEALGLDPGADVDLARFEAEARAALDAPPAAQEPLVRRALGRYAGELLPADRYEEFAAAARERAAMRHLALLDRLAVVTAARGDVDEALAVLEEAIAAEPLDDHRYRTAIGIALQHGRRDRATRLLERALAMELELAGEPSAELLDLARSLGAAVGGDGGTAVVRRTDTMRP